MWQFYSKKELLIKLFTVGSQLCKKVHNIHTRIHGIKAAKGGYLWDVRVISILFIHFCIFLSFLTMSMYYFIIQKVQAIVIFL